MKHFNTYKCLIDSEWDASKQKTVKIKTNTERNARKQIYKKYGDNCIILSITLIK